MGRCLEKMKTTKMTKAAWKAEGYARRIRIRTATYEKAARECGAALLFVDRMMTAHEREALKKDEHARYAELMRKYPPRSLQCHDLGKDEP